MVIGVRELLERIRKNHNSIGILWEQRERLRSLATLHSQLPDGMPHAGISDDRMARLVGKINELTARYQDLMDQLLADQAQAEQIYARLDPRQANALRCYYSMAMTWEEAGEACGYSLSHIKELGRQGIWKAEEVFAHGIKVRTKSDSFL